MRYVKLLSHVIPRKNIFIQSKRTFLSDAFECTDVWNSRLTNPLISKVESEALYYELNGTFNKTRKINAIDVDLFLNAQADDKFITEVEEITHKLRQTAECCNVLPTTHHAFIRLFADTNKTEDIIRILHDRINYGIFPDNYCMIYLMNRFLKKNEYRNAARVASLKMFQEDFSCDLVKYLSLYSVLKYLPTNESWGDQKTKESEEDPDEEPILVKVPYLRNPYFDDHFDLTDGQQICGKTLVMIASKMSGELADSLKVLGLALYNKWDKLSEFLNKFMSTDNKIHLESLKLAEGVVKDKLQDSEKADTILNLLKKFDEKRYIKGSMIECAEKLVTEEVARSENTFIETQKQLYKDWEKLREDKLQAYLEEMTKRKRLEEVEHMKKELKHREELLYYFDREEEYEVEIERKEELKRKRKYYDKNVVENEDDYIPPEIRPRASQ